jgi:hypothetical protein
MASEVGKTRRYENRDREWCWRIELGIVCSGVKDSGAHRIGDDSVMKAV